MGQSGWEGVGATGGGEFTKFEAGKPVVVHVLGDEPTTQYKHWVTGNKAVDCTAPDCPHCSAGIKRNARYRIKVFNLTTGAVEQMEGGAQIFGTIRDIRNVHDGDISQLDFHITKKGSGLETEYTVVNIPTKFKAEAVADEPLPF